MKSMRILMGIVALVALVAVSAYAAAPQADAPAVDTEAVEAPAPELDLFAPEAQQTQGNPGCQGQPDPDCVCPLVYDPVCGCNGVTYSNDCFARCDGVRQWTEGACE